MTQMTALENKTILPDLALTARESSLLGFGEKYRRVNAQLRLILNMPDLANWSKQFYKSKLPVCELVSEQYPLVIFHGDVGTGKTATAECVANRLARESKCEDPLLFRLSNRVRGSGRVGEMGTMLTQAFADVIQSAGKTRRAFLIIDEADSLATVRSQEQSHHEDKVAVNTLIQCIDELRRHGGRVVAFLCTNRLSVLDPALIRRAAIVEEFCRPNEEERFTLLSTDLEGLGFSGVHLKQLAKVTGATKDAPAWTYSDFRTRLYPAALAMAFPDRAVSVNDFLTAASQLSPSPVMENK